MKKMNLFHTKLLLINQSHLKSNKKNNNSALMAYKPIKSTTLNHCRKNIVESTSRIKSKRRNNQLSIQPSKKKQNLQNKKPSKFLQDQITMTEPNDHQIRYLFDKAVDRIFQLLDIFSRGTVSQANISHQIPEKALYFLGEAFQKIRLSRKPVTRQFFQNQCIKLFRKSSQQDICQFIKSFPKLNNNQQKSSGESDQKKTLQSRVEDRVVFNQQKKKFEEHQHSFVSFSNKKSDIMTLQKEGSIRKQQTSNRIHEAPLKGDREENSKNILGVKWKPQKNTLSPLLQINNFEKINITQGVQKNLYSQKQIKQNADFYQKNQSPCFRMSRLHLDQKKNQWQFNNQNLYNEPYANTYKREQNTNIYKREQSNKLQLKKYTIEYKHTNQRQFDYQYPKEFEYRQGQQNKLKQQRTDHTRVKQSNDKLDKLSNRLEDFIKQNAQRLEKSMNVRNNL